MLVSISWARKTQKSQNTHSSKQHKPSEDTPPHKNTCRIFHLNSCSWAAELITNKPYEFVLKLPYDQLQNTSSKFQIDPEKIWSSYFPHFFISHRQTIKYNHFLKFLYYKVWIFLEGFKILIFTYHLFE